MKSVTVTLGENNRHPPDFTKGFKKGQVIGISDYKRIRVKVTEIQPGENEVTLTCIKGYYPSPNSKLRKQRQSPFSKIHSRILN